MKDTDDFIRREFLGQPVLAAPSPGPWSIKEHRERDRFTDHVNTVWIVLDANSKCVAECDRQRDAIHIAENGPRPSEHDGVTHGGKKR